jgi:hypothetical protein
MRPSAQGGLDELQAARRRIAAKAAARLMLLKLRSGAAGCKKAE